MIKRAALNKNCKDQYRSAASKNGVREFGRAIFSTEVEALLLWVSSTKAASGITPAKAECDLLARKENSLDFHANPVLNEKIT
ncbi:MAG: hypothetical protein K2X02_01700 [Alphaproteobacteria bacterium]|nr:hypothetical protein [Alphaproteobacteria bacterium]